MRCFGVATFLVLAASGCVSREYSPGPGPRRVLAGEPGGPFAPVAARLHPLTRFEADPVGGAIELIAHVELRDRWGDSVKGAGVARFVLWESVGAEDGSTLRWEVDLTDLALNAAHYDPSTRTYRFELKGVGAWATSGGVTLSVAYDVVGGNGSIETLRDRAVVGG